jgi:hypothetical protein
MAECPVCLHRLDSAVSCLYACNHVVCLPCHIQSLQANRTACPLCREPTNVLQFEGALKLFVRSHCGRCIYTLPVERDTTLGQVRFMLAQASGIPGEMVYLLRDGRLLNSRDVAASLSDLAIPPDTVLSCVLKLRGD